MRTTRRLTVGLVSSLLLLVGCDSKSGGAAAAPAAAAAKKAEAPTSSVAAGPEYVYQYSPVGKRDPFRSPLSDMTVSQNSTGRTLCNEPLCQWELEQLVLVAVVTGDANPIAMVEDPSGRGHIIRRNTKLGKQDGRVTQILRDRVIVTELWQQPDGKTKPNPAEMKLKQDVASIPPVDMLTGQPYQ